MDDEIRDALELTKEELLARAAKGEPADVAHSAPQSGSIRIDADFDSIVIEDVHLEKGHFEDRRPMKVERPRVIIR